ncbi:hypothetical protein D8674_021852 [Pyrus ussuriensis x Pyrus communis]|uniref:Retrovirus-related Pol polyprotein from transposon TNT 1-94-like beta-barrel domain-containing protein n=2 Tax=Maleae TaxID=721813 RepID=A0A5N5GWV1_9ROSA|nr:hypothetical protein D8674_021852 [Pyrus ussuriensis x Pyrus communis]
MASSSSSNVQCERTHSQDGPYDLSVSSPYGSQFLAIQVWTTESFSKTNEINNEVYNVYVGNGSKVAVESIGSVQLVLSSGFILKLSSLLYVPSMRRSLILASKLYSEVGQHKGPFATFLQEHGIMGQYTTPVILGVIVTILLGASYVIKSRMSETPFRPREQLYEKQKIFQSIHKHTYLKGPYDKITSVAIPAALAATSLFLIGRGIYNMSHGIGKKE